MESIGVIGLGKMGRPIAGHLLKAGYRVFVHNRSQEAARELAGVGATNTSTPAELASMTDLIITSLPDTPTLEMVCLGEKGVREGARNSSILIDTSTSHPETTQRLANVLATQGMEMLDAPVSGGEPGAIAATLSIMVGGPEATFMRALPVLQKIGRTITYMGATGSGQLAKLANQVIVALNYVAIGEGLVFGAKAGLDPAKLIEVLQGGLAQSSCLAQKGQRIIDGNYEPGARLTIQIKDLQYALETAHAYGVPLPFTSMVQQFYEAAKAAGRQDWDHSAIVTLFEDLAGVKIRRKQ